MQLAHVLEWDVLLGTGHLLVLEQIQVERRPRHLRAQQRLCYSRNLTFWMITLLTIVFQKVTVCEMIKFRNFANAPSAKTKVALASIRVTSGGSGGPCG